MAKKRKPRRAYLKPYVAEMVKVHRSVAPQALLKPEHYNTFALRARNQAAQSIGEPLARTRGITAERKSVVERWHEYWIPVNLEPEIHVLWQSSGDTFPARQGVDKFHRIRIIDFPTWRMWLYFSGPKWVWVREEEINEGDFRISVSFYYKSKQQALDAYNAEPPFHKVGIEWKHHLTLTPKSENQSSPA